MSIETIRGGQETVGWEPLVAKFGGTSMAQPNRVVEQLETGEFPDIVVVSAPGRDADHPTKVTDMLLGYATGKVDANEIRQRFDDILDANGMGGDAPSKRIVQAIPSELNAWWRVGNPVEALGEYWSAKLLAARTGRQFVDASAIIRFGADGLFDEQATNAALHGTLSPGGRYVVPGFYGSRPDGGVQVFPRGGSDITGSVISRGLGARRYDNWSDVPGFMSADPRKVADARLLSDITYREARELSNGGSELLHRTVIRMLGHTGIPTAMRNTFGELGNVGTEVVPTRDWQDQPIVAVSGRKDMLALTLHEFGLNEGAGKTTFLYDTLRDEGVPYEHAGTATDDVGVFIPDIQQHEETVRRIAEELASDTRNFDIEPVGMLHVVGEGLAQSDENRWRILSIVAGALATKDISGHGATDLRRSITQTLFIGHEEVDDAIRIAHEALGLGQPG